MELIDKLKWRYASKAMNGEKISQEKLDTILEAAILAPHLVVYNLLRLW
jgi:nitroreductase